MQRIVAKQKRKKKTRKMGTLPHLRPLHLETIIGKYIITSLPKEPSKWMIVEGFISTTVVIPDLGGQTNDYFVLKAQEDWKDIFHKWLLDSDKGDISDEEDDDDEDTEDVQDVLGNNWDDAESEVTDNEEEVTDDEDDDESTDEEED
jgi:hypothetical protein